MQPITIKVQRPLSSDDPNPDYLIYDESREIQFMVATGGTLDMFFEEGQLKVYLYANLKAIKNKHTIDITGVAPNQDW